MVEFDWGDEVILEDHDGGRPRLKAICVPCQHWCKRTLTDTNKCLWCSWVVQTLSAETAEQPNAPRLSYFFGGDTGYCGGVFRRVGDAYGPMDLAAIPIGAYGVPAERWFHQPNHMDTDEAVACHCDLRARQSVSIHWVPPTRNQSCRKTGLACCMLHVACCRGTRLFAPK